MALIEKTKFDAAAKISETITRALDAIQAGEPEKANAELRPAIAAAIMSDMVSPTLHWALAVVADEVNLPDEAVNNIMAALQLDPCSPAFRNTYAVICAKSRTTFDRTETNDTTLSYVYSLLDRLGIATAADTDRYSECASANGHREAALEAARFAARKEPTPERLQRVAELEATGGEPGMKRDGAVDQSRTFPQPPARA